MANGGRFDRVAEGLRVESVDSAAGRVTCSLTVHEGVLNGYGTLHGGAITTLVDIAGTMALLARDAGKPGVSIELNTTFLAVCAPRECPHLPVPRLCHPATCSMPVRGCAPRREFLCCLEPRCLFLHLRA